MTVALARGDLAAANVSDAHRELLSFAKLLTLQSWRTSNEDVDRLRLAGFSDAQIAEAVYIVGLFAMFNRVADAFGLVDMGPPLAG